jgi:hypothetical protein
MKDLKYIFAATILTLVGCNNSNTSSSNENTTTKSEVDICKCLTEPGTSDYMTQNGTACDIAISKELGVADWNKVNMKYDKETSKKFDELVYKCTGQRPKVEISGTYSGTDNVGMESTIILRSGGGLIIQASVGDGTPDYGSWTGTADNLSFYHKDVFGNDELIGRAEVTNDGLRIGVTNDGLRIIGGKFYSRQ